MKKSTALGTCNTSFAKRDRVQYFITSTGTNIGKTLVTSAIAYGLIQSGQPATAIKPVISGYNPLEESDLTQLCFAQNLPNNTNSHNSISLYRFAEPISPDMAARNLNSSIDFNEIKNFIAGFASAKNLLIEGAGGLMSPLTEKHTNLDLALAINAPVILVCGSYLGSISHTLTAYEVLKSRNIAIAKIIVTQNLQPNAQLYINPHETIKTLSNFISENIILLDYIEGDMQQKIIAASKLCAVLNPC
jgi:dethiobiotin synthetase